MAADWIDEHVERYDLSGVDEQALRSYDGLNDSDLALMFTSANERAAAMRASAAAMEAKVALIAAVRDERSGTPKTAAG